MFRVQIHLNSVIKENNELIYLIYNAFQDYSTSIQEIQWLAGSPSHNLSRTHFNTVSFQCLILRLPSSPLLSVETHIFLLIHYLYLTYERKGQVMGLCGRAKVKSRTVESLNCSVKGVRYHYSFPSTYSVGPNIYFPLSYFTCNQHTRGRDGCWEYVGIRGKEEKNNKKQYPIPKNI